MVSVVASQVALRSGTAAPASVASTRKRSTTAPCTTDQLTYAPVVAGVTVRPAKTAPSARARAGRVTTGVTMITQSRSRGRTGRAGRAAGLGVPGLDFKSCIGGPLSMATAHHLFHERSAPVASG